MRLKTVRQVKHQQQQQQKRPEAESIVDYFLRNMYGTQQQLQDHTMYNNMNSNMMEASLIPGSTGMSSSPTTMLQQPSDLYSNGNGGGNMISSLRTHSSKFPIERELILSTDKNGSKVPLKQYPRQIPTTPVAFNRSSTSNGNGIGSTASGVIQQFLPKSGSTVAPDHPTPKHFQAWNQQNANQIQEKGQSITGAIPRTPTRLPEDVTALAEREMGGKDGKESKNAVSKTYHTLKDLISSKFKKDSSEMTPEELNNVTIQQQSQNYQSDDLGNTPYYNLMQQHMQMQQQQTHPQQQQQSSWHSQNVSQQQQQQQQQQQPPPQIWNGNRQVLRDPTVQQHQQLDMNGQQIYTHMVATRASIHQHRANSQSQPQLNMAFKEQSDDRRGSLANIDVTDSDEGGFSGNKLWRPTTQQRTLPGDSPSQQILLQQQQNYLKRSTLAQQSQSQQILSTTNGHYQPHVPSSSFHLHPQQLLLQSQGIPDGVYASQVVDLSKQQQELAAQSTNGQDWNGGLVRNQENLRTSFGHEIPQLNQKGEKQVPPIPPAKPPQIQPKKAPNYEHPPKPEMKKPMETSTPSSSQNTTQMSLEQNGNKQIPGSAASSDYDKSGNHSSNVDSGRGSAAYSSGRKAALDTSPDHSDTPVPQSRPKSNDSEWIDIVDAELRHILEPGLQNLNLRPESTISGSLSSISPPLPPLSPDGSIQHTNTTNNHTTSSNTITSKINTNKSQIPQKRGEQMRSSISKKQEQSMMKRHLFGLDDLTSTTTRSLDLDSLLGGQWGAGQSVSDSETDTQGLRHIKSQLEGLETMYSEVLKMLGARPNGAGRVNESLLRNTRRRQGSLSSLPSSSVSGRPVRDRRRNDERRKVRDIKGINKRFQRLESHVVTLARSVAHLSSEMRSQHLVTQELEQLRQDLNYRMQQSQFNFHNKSMDNGADTADGPNLTNPKRVKKLTKFFGEDPPLMRLFLKKLGYEKYAPLFEAERVGMIELPYLGEERLQKLGVPLGPRLRILQEAQISLIKDKTLCIV
ncbi:unnamed protein product [Diamesa hyperborea]